MMDIITMIGSVSDSNVLLSPSAPEAHALEERCSPMKVLTNCFNVMFIKFSHRDQTSVILELHWNVMRMCIKQCRHYFNNQGKMKINIYSTMHLLLEQSLVNYTKLCTGVKERYLFVIMFPTKELLSELCIGVKIVFTYLEGIILYETHFAVYFI